MLTGKPPSSTIEVKGRVREQGSLSESWCDGSINGVRLDVSEEVEALPKMYDGHWHQYRRQREGKLDKQASIGESIGAAQKGVWRVSIT